MTSPQYPDELCPEEPNQFHELGFKFEKFEGTSVLPLGAFPRDLSLEETVDYLAEELGLQRSEHVRETGESVAELRD